METAIVRPFADGNYKFWLPLPRVIAAEREMSRDRPRSIFALFYDLGDSLGQTAAGFVLAGPSEATIAECQAVIRNALSGGDEGMVSGDIISVGDTLAKELVETYCYPARPAMLDIELCWRILEAAIYGIKLPEDAKKKTDEPIDAPSPS